MYVLRYNLTVTISIYLLVLLSIVQKEDETLCTIKELESFLNLSRCKLVSEEIVNFFEEFLIKRYFFIFPKSDSNVFVVQRLATALETFYEFQ